MGARPPLPKGLVALTAFGLSFFAAPLAFWANVALDGGRRRGASVRDPWTGPWFPDTLQGAYDAALLAGTWWWWIGAGLFVVVLVVAFALLRGDAWARLVLVVLWSAAAVVFLLDATLRATEADALAAAVALAWALGAAAVVAYLHRPRVRAYFQPAEARPREG